MRGLVLFSIMIIVISLFSFIVFSSNNQEVQMQKSSNLEFKTYTSAVCENSGDFVKCKDELFVNCNGKVSKASDVKECNGIKIDAQKITGFAVFEKEWKDTRK